jgi:hypothetical protein
MKLDIDLVSAVKDAGFEFLDFTASEAMRLRDLPFHHEATDPLMSRLARHAEALGQLTHRVAIELPVSDDIRSLFFHGNSLPCHGVALLFQGIGS